MQWASLLCDLGFGSYRINITEIYSDVVRFTSLLNPKRYSLQARKPETMDDDQLPFPDRHRHVPSGKAEDARVLLRFLGSLFQLPRFQTDPDGHRQQLSCDLIRPAGRHRPPQADDRI